MDVYSSVLAGLYVESVRDVITSALLVLEVALHVLVVGASLLVLGCVLLLRLDRVLRSDEEKRLENHLRYEYVSISSPRFSYSAGWVQSLLCACLCVCVPEGGRGSEMEVLLVNRRRSGRSLLVL